MRTSTKAVIAVYVVAIATSQAQFPEPVISANNGVVFRLKGTLTLPVSLSLPLFLSLCLSPSLSLCVSLPLCFRVFVCLRLSVSLPPSLCFSLFFSALLVTFKTKKSETFLYRSLCLSVFVSFFLSPPVSFCVCVSPNN